ncbi:MAG: 4-hydroxythreonine-4-phosphate dehydrogenase PdxA [Bacteroidia bacterium]
MNKLRIGITMGDINGIGPELILKTFQDGRLRGLCIPIIYGSARILNIYKKLFQIEKFHYANVPHAGAARPGTVNIVECLPDVERVDIGLPSEMGGRCALMSLDRALEDAVRQNIDALVTMPVDKATVRLNKPDFTGHTEMIADTFGLRENLMMMVADEMKIALVTNHVAVRDISRNLSVQRIVSKAKLLIDSLKQDFSIDKPIIAVLGLNPHAGDDKMMGDEEEKLIRPAIQKLQEEGHMVYGPYSPDGYFGSLNYKKFDATLAMYHDQGLIPFKLLVGTNGVNFTAGMPFVRTSPDHGLAYNIAGKGIADETSFRNALYVAIDVFNRRSENQDLKANALVVEKGYVPQEEATVAKFDDLPEVE